MKQKLSWLGILFSIALIADLFIEAISRKSMTAVFTYIGQAPVVFLLNTLIVLIPFMLAFLTRRKLFVIGLVLFLWIFMGVINGVLLIYRTTPFTAADFRLVKYALNMLDDYLTWFQIGLIIGGLMIALGGSFWLWQKAPLDRAPVSYRTAFCYAGMVVLAMTGTAKWCLAHQYLSERYGNIGQAYQDYGFAYCFSNSVFQTGIPKPESYGEEAVWSIEQQELVPESKFVLSEEQAPNIIMIQLESFFDPSRWQGYQGAANPVPFFSYLREFYPSGYLSVPSVGAGTANTEFECITGMNLDFFGPGEYPYKTVLQKKACESIAFDMRAMGYRAHAIHNNEGTFYDRHKVFAQLGFDTFTPIEYMNQIERTPTGWCKDQILVNQITRALDSTSNQDFVYAITVQSHGPYADLDYFYQQIKEVDLFIKDLIVEMSKRNEPTVVVLYGDHLPGFEWSAEEMVNQSLYQTEYVIWNNLNLPKQKQDLEAYQLSAYVLDLLGIHEGTMMRYHQKHFNTGSTDLESYLENMRILEYDILYGDHTVYEGEQPFVATDLQMGIDPIAVDFIVYSDQNLLVFGENFNTYSEIYINDRAVETLYAGKKLLISKKLPKKLMGEQAVAVKQVGRDKISLGEVAAGSGKKPADVVDQ